MQVKNLHMVMHGDHLWQSKSRLSLRLSPNMNATCICTEVLERFKALEAHDESDWFTDTYQNVGIVLSPIVSVMVDKLLDKLLALCTPRSQQKPTGA